MEKWYDCIELGHDLCIKKTERRIEFYISDDIAGCICTVELETAKRIQKGIGEMLKRVA